MESFVSDQMMDTDGTTPPRATAPAKYLNVGGNLSAQQIYDKLKPRKDFISWQSNRFDEYTEENSKSSIKMSFDDWLNAYYEEESKPGFFENILDTIKEKTKDVTKEDIDKGATDVKDTWNKFKGLFGKGDETDNTKKDKKDKNDKKGISPLAIGGIVLLVLVGGTLAIYFATRNKGGKTITKVE